jgi:hypothetical protein
MFLPKPFPVINPEPRAKIFLRPPANSAPSRSFVPKI